MSKTAAIKAIDRSMLNTLSEGFEMQESSPETTSVVSNARGAP